jgi:CoA:oxalate CoA-transferase
MSNLPLHGLTVLEFCQYLSGPSAGLRLADMGARVIKIERPRTGDAGRNLSIKNLWVDDSSLLFYTINRNKESFVVDMKNPDDLAVLRKLIAKADVLTHNFRPGVMEKAGLDYAAVQQINPGIIYAAISGYGNKGPWQDKPGQDLLLQSLSGLAYTTGNEDDDPMPFGLAIADNLCGAQLVQGILAALIRRHKTKKGALIELSLLESMLDFQFELLTTFYASGKQPVRSSINNGHPLLASPYGIYATADSFIAIAMVGLKQLAAVIECSELDAYNQEDAFSNRDTIKNIIATHLLTKPCSYWIDKLHAEDIWAMEVLDWKSMVKHEAYKCLLMEQHITAINGKQIVTTRCPVRINDTKLYSDKPAPQLGEHNGKIYKELKLREAANNK